MRVRLGWALAASASFVTLVSSCGGGKPSCGIQFGPSASIEGGGTVTFAPVAVGQSEKLTLTVKDITSDAETITGAQIAGVDQGAFQVLTTFPLEVPVTGGATVVIQFVPSKTGISSADLSLSTTEMAPAQAQLQGTG